MKLFNLNEEEIAYVATRKIHALVIYDIVKTKRRNKLVKILEGYGIRVQKSCFEVQLDSSSFSSLEDELAGFYSESEDDNIIVYRIPKDGINRLNGFDEVVFHDDLIFL